MGTFEESVRRWISSHPLAAYCGLAYATSWSVAVPLALQAQHVVSLRLPFALHYTTAFGPAIAAIIVSNLSSEGPRSRQRVSLGWRLPWYLIGLASPLAMFVVAQIIAYSMGRPLTTWRELGDINFLPSLGVMAWGFWFLTSGVGEELGWRGFALPNLQKTHSALASSVLLGLIWAGWHAPAFFYLPSYIAIGPRLLPGFLLGILAGSIVLTSLYNGSGGSVLTVVLWHASFNFVSASPHASGLTAAVTSTMVMLWALLALAIYGASRLAKQPKHETAANFALTQEPG